MNTLTKNSVLMSEITEILKTNKTFQYLTNQEIKILLKNQKLFGIPTTTKLLPKEKSNPLFLLF